MLGSNPVAVWPKAYICGLSIASIAGLSRTENMDIRLLCCEIGGLFKELIAC